MAKRRYGTNKRLKEIARQEKAREKMERRKAKKKMKTEDFVLISDEEEQANKKEHSL